LTTQNPHDIGFAVWCHRGPPGTEIRTLSELNLLTRAVVVDVAHSNVEFDRGPFTVAAG
jgi:hypothetical protein